MSEGGQGEGPGPYEDLFGDYEPDRAFAHLAITRLERRIQEAGEESAIAFLSHDVETPIAKSAAKSAELVMQDLYEGLYHLKSRLAKAMDAEDAGAVLDGELYEMLCREAETLLQKTIPAISHEDAPYTPAQPAPIPTPEDADLVSARVGAQLATEVKKRRGSDVMEVIALIVTAGVGKTHQMIETLVTEVCARERVTACVRTKEMLDETNPDSFISRAKERSRMRPGGSRIIHLPVVGRDESNCPNFKAVESAMEHGYAPGQTVCLGCEHFPTNAPTAGTFICGYYEMRMIATRYSKEARAGRQPYFPVIYMTHAAYVASHLSSGGRYGNFVACDLTIIDEDCTDAIETDVILGETGYSFFSKDPEYRSVVAACKLLKAAAEIADEDRRVCQAEGFVIKPGAPRNSHPLHTDYGSSITGHDLQALLRRAYERLKGRGDQLPNEPHGVMRNMRNMDGFHVGSGVLAGVQSSDDINRLNIPSHRLLDVCSGIHREMDLREKMEHIAFREIRGDAAIDPTMTAQEVIDERARHTNVEPMSYVVRLECLPRDVTAGRMKNEWRYVLRKRADFAPNNTVVIGDAYGDPEHYAELFRVKPVVIRGVAKLHPETRIVRLLHDRCSRRHLEEGWWPQIVLHAEQILRADGRLCAGLRVLVYVHEALVPIMRGEIEAWKERYGLAEVAIEHWWGGRGKDAYNGYDVVVCLSDPVMNVGALQHVTNARAFEVAATPGASDADVMEHGRRVELAPRGGGAITARKMRASDERVQREHERMNVSEVTQAIHRPRPVRNPTFVLIVGNSELNREVLAQTYTVVPSDLARVGRGRKSAKSATITSGYVEQYVSSTETYNQMLNVLDHLGLFFPWLFPALEVLPTHVGASAIRNSDANGDRDALVVKQQSHLISINRRLLHNLGGESHEPLVDDPTRPEGTRRAEPDLAQDRSGGTVAAQRAAQWLTAVGRAWDPPIHWQERCTNRTTSRAIQAAWAKLKAAEHVQLLTMPWPSWHASSKKGGRRPQAVFHRSTDVQDAEMLWRRLTETQYGPVGPDGQLVRPNFNPVLPQPWVDVPF